MGAFVADNKKSWPPQAPFTSGIKHISVYVLCPIKVSRYCTVVDEEVVWLGGVGCWGVNKVGGPKNDPYRFAHNCAVRRECVCAYVAFIARRHQLRAGCQIRIALVFVLVAVLY